MHIDLLVTRINDVSASDAAATEVVDLAALGGTGGAIWSVSPGGVHTNLVALASGDSIAHHRNDEVDVLVVVLEGFATVRIEDTGFGLSSHTAVMIPRGVTRSVEAGPVGVRYLSIHAERAPLAPGRRRGRSLEEHP